MIMIIICRRFFELVFVVSLSIGDLDYLSCHGSSDDICRPFLLFAFCPPSVCRRGHII